MERRAGVLRFCLNFLISETNVIAECGAQDRLEDHGLGDVHVFLYGSRQVVDDSFLFLRQLEFIWCCRSNISQANTDNFLKDIGATTDDFNFGNSLYKACFLIAGKLSITGFNKQR